MDVRESVRESEKDLHIQVKRSFKKRNNRPRNRNFNTLTSNLPTPPPLPLSPLVSSIHGQDPWKKRGGTIDMPLSATSH